MLNCRQFKLKYAVTLTKGFGHPSFNTSYKHRLDLSLF